MTGERSDLRFWLIGAAVFAGLLVLLGDILMPFVAGMAVAYLLDPLVERLARRGVSRTLGTAIVLGLFFLLAIGLVLMLVPLLHTQIAAFAGRVPGYIERAKAAIGPLWDLTVSRVSDEDLKRLPELAGSHAGQALQVALKFAGGLISGGGAVANLLSLIFITPLVAFYLLRDWPKVVGAIDRWLPRAQADTIREQLAAIDLTLAGFVRGQAMVCFALAVLYALGLGLIGLDFGLVVGVFAGLISFIPFVGTLVGGGLAVALGLAQFGLTAKLGMVAMVFVVGQALEGNVLTPKLVGDRIGLHPVWIILALLAGSALFGFLGVLLAVPAAAVAGVLARFALKRYLASSVYRGRGEGT